MFTKNQLDLFIRFDRTPTRDGQTYRYIEPWHGPCSHGVARAKKSRYCNMFESQGHGSQSAVTGGEWVKVVDATSREGFLVS